MEPVWVRAFLRFRTNMLRGEQPKDRLQETEYVGSRHDDYDDNGGRDHKHYKTPLSFPKTPRQQRTLKRETSQVSPRPSLMQRKMKDEEIHFSETADDDFSWCCEENGDLVPFQTRDTPSPFGFKIFTEEGEEDCQHHRDHDLQQAYCNSRARQSIDNDQVW
ncbi:hypothetical protein BASA81_005858 [Batrachochytrium salamandrivorans]|nr:hypothetical protein BASA81_005858 [Batrachochytrium salamandrivorans]